VEPIEDLWLLVFSVWCRFSARKIELSVFHNFQTNPAAHPTSYPIDTADKELGE
jgi:hypothetical protein